VMRREKEINDLADQLRDKYIDILNQGIGRPSDSIMFVDIVSSLERMSDHAVRIARHAEGSRYPFQSKKAPTIGVELKEPANESDPERREVMACRLQLCLNCS